MKLSTNEFNFKIYNKFTYYGLRFVENLHAYLKFWKKGYCTFWTEYFVKQFLWQIIIQDLLQILEFCLIYYPWTMDKLAVD